MLNFCKLFIFIFLVSAVSLSSSSNAGSEYSQAECLKVPASSFMSSLKTTVDAIQQVVPVISNFANLFGDFRLTNAISDCLDLLDFSADELSWSISASQNPTGDSVLNANCLVYTHSFLTTGRHNGSGDLSSDLRTWLSAALINQETCIDGFDGTNGIVKGVVSGSLNQISSSVQELLTMVHPSPSQWSNEGSSSNSVGKSRGGGGKSSGQFPHWFKREDRKLLLVNGVQADVVVAADGTGNFTKIMDAVLAAEDYSMKRFVIYIKRGVYKENVEIKKKKWNLMMVGDGIDATIISGNRNFMDGWTTFRSATFAVSGRGFIARDITFENTAGPEKHQAVALRSDSDLSVYFRCAIKGYQDSLYTHTMRQFFRECKISGTVDFIFGDATAMFQNCQILAKKGLDNQKNTITAHGRKDPNEPTGFSIQFCNITADSDLLPFVNSTETYLGRPWKPYSRTVFMQSYMSNVIRPKGWLEWNNDFALDTLYYGEYKNYGPGGGLATRITWPGYHILNNAVQANNFTVAQFLEGNLWLPSTGVKYTAGLQV